MSMVRNLNPINTAFFSRKPMKPRVSLPIMCQPTPKQTKKFNWDSGDNKSLIMNGPRLSALIPLVCVSFFFFSQRRLGHGHLLPAVREALPDPDGAAAAHGGPRRRPQLHLQRVQPDFPQPHCTQASPALTHRSVERALA